MRKLYIIQWGKERSLVKEFYSDNKEINILMIDNQHLMNLDEIGLIV